MRKRILFSLVLTVFFVTISCQSIGPKYPTLNQDWSKITITAKGEGTPPDKVENSAQAQLLACRAARMDAYRNLAEKIYRVKVSGNTCVNDYIIRDDRIYTGVQGFIKKALVRETTKEDGSCEVILELYLGKKFVDILIR